MRLCARHIIPPNSSIAAQHTRVCHVSSSAGIKAATEVWAQEMDVEAKKQRIDSALEFILGIIGPPSAENSLWWELRMHATSTRAALARVQPPPPPPPYVEVAASAAHAPPPALRALADAGIRFPNMCDSVALGARPHGGGFRLPPKSEWAQSVPMIR